MGYDSWVCKFCKYSFGWCSVGTFSSWGEHKEGCEGITNKDHIMSMEDYIKSQST